MVLLKVRFEMAAKRDGSRREERVSVGGSSRQIGLNGAAELSAAASHSKRDSDGRELQQSGRAAQTSNGSQAAVLMNTLLENERSTAFEDRERILADCRQKRHQFEDEHFPASDLSFFGQSGRRPEMKYVLDERIVEVFWFRPEEIPSRDNGEYSELVLFSGAPSARDVQQGQLGFLLCSSYN